MLQKSIKEKNIKKPNVLINGFGRIGRAITRLNIAKNIFNLVAINDINPDINNMAYLLKYDCTYGKLDENIEVHNNIISVNNNKIIVSHKKNINELNFDNIDIVIDSSGIISNINQIEKMESSSSVRHFIITNANSKRAKTIIFGVNETQKDLYKKNKILSSSICDSVAFSPIYKLLNNNFGVKSGFLVTLHPWLSYQNLLDGPSVSWSQPGDIYSHYALGRASVQNIIPKSTSAINAASLVFDDLKNKFQSFSYRVPTQTVASAVLTAVLNKKANVKDIMHIFEEYENKQKYKVIKTLADPLTSVDYLKEEYSVVIDTRWIKVINDRHIKLVYWYDNEWGYSNKILEIISLISGEY